MALEQNGTAATAIVSDELITKEAHYHARYCRSYTRPNHTPVSEKRHDIDLINALKFLSDLYDNPEAVPFKRLQKLVATRQKRKISEEQLKRKLIVISLVKFKKNF